MQSVWLNPGVFEPSQQNLQALAAVLDTSVAQIKRRLAANQSFVFLRRQVEPATAQAVLALGLNGVHAQTEYKRFYPAAEFAAHIVGFTDVEDRGQEGVELAFDHILQGQAGQRKVMRNALGETIKDIGLLKAASSGGQLQLAIDMNLQYIAYRELKAAVAEHDARSGSLVILDVDTGEVLALVNQPSYNVNDRSQLLPARTRNRALIDVFEPGSTVKPFTVAAALEHGDINPSTVIDTTPGVIRLGNKAIVDPRDYGKLNVSEVLVKSSQVGTTKISLGMPAEQLRSMLSRVGFGEYCATGFPGEQVGFLPHHRKWQPVQRAALSYGHGMSVNLMQLARAYAVIAADGVKRPVSLLKHDAGHAAAGLLGNADATDKQVERVLEPGIAAEIRRMMVDVVDHGTGKAAQIPGYSVAGKTGTTHRVGRLGYEENRYRATFAGMLPANAPRLVVAVTIDDPRGEKYFGGEIAAPVFARVMQAAVRQMNIAPDRPEQLDIRYAQRPVAPSAALQTASAGKAG
ncbi:MAG: penicillin-binding protein 2 [Pseudomonadales bacterium]|nr:penicillin-binding protein 2 [Pseudomonadales bacterium]